MANDIISMNAGEIVLYQPDENIKLEVKLDADLNTVWLSKRQMAELFGRNRTTISRHINNAFEQGEVDPKVGCAFFCTDHSSWCYSDISSLTIRSICLVTL